MSRVSELVSASLSADAMADRLLDRQARLLEYLSSAATVFGDRADASGDPVPEGLDRTPLRLQARFACNKRLEKIVAVFPRTLRAFGAGQRRILREFVAVSPPANKGTLANAREFHEFLSVCWQDEAPEPAYLPDVAACELAMAEAGDVLGESDNQAAREALAVSTGGIRRRRNAVPLRCAHDIRSMFDAAAGEAVLPRRDMCFVVVSLATTGEVRIVEVSPTVLEVVTLLGDWVDRGRLDAFGDRDHLIGYLAAQGFIEERA